MANPEYVEILKQGVKAWNQWRKKNPGTKPILIEESLRGADLRTVDFSRSVLRDTSLHTRSCVSDLRCY
jgi:uncharacterized protein YjbI with pentapeptide repeats